jgi:putative ABC transport system ATP-binding protein
MSDNLIEVRQVSKTYGKGENAVHALKKVDLKIPRGAFMMINGPSGSGKSTLLNILGFLDRPTEGEILYDDQVVAIKDFNDLAFFRSRRVGFIFQSFNLIPVLSAWENVMIPLLIREDLSQNEKNRRVDYYIDAVGISDRAAQKPDQLSGGQKQRVSIARAMVSESPIVLADEPTASLDTENSLRILELMKKMSQDKGTAFIFSTHDPRVEKYAQERILLRDGTLEKIN